MLSLLLDRMKAQIDESDVEIFWEAQLENALPLVASNESRALPGVNASCARHRFATWSKMIPDAVDRHGSSEPTNLPLALRRTDAGDPVAETEEEDC